jgi:F0F1-type ATP synthase membrane subunit b/b'
MKTLAKRQQDLKDLQTQKETLQKSQGELNTKKSELSEKVQKENQEAYDKIIAEAKEEKLKIIAEARGEADSIKESANKRLETEKQKLNEEMEARLTEAVRKVMEDIYQGQKAEIDKSLIQKALKELS